MWLKENQWFLRAGDITAKIQLIPQYSETGSVLSWTWKCPLLLNWYQICLIEMRNDSNYARCNTKNTALGIRTAWVSALILVIWDKSSSLSMLLSYLCLKYIVRRDHYAHLPVFRVVLDELKNRKHYDYFYILPFFIWVYRVAVHLALSFHDIQMFDFGMTYTYEEQEQGQILPFRTLDGWMM